MRLTLALVLAAALVPLNACGGDDDGGGGPSDGGLSSDASPLTPDVDAGDEPDAVVPLVDARVEPDAQVAEGACDPVAQTGCAAGEKCSWLTVAEEPALGKTDCVPDGSVDIDGACTEGEPGTTTGYDDCVAGGLCTGGVCAAICSDSPDTCGADALCTTYFQLFDDLGADATVGLCNATCDPVGQDQPGYDDCADGEGCYLSAASGKALCANVPVEATDHGQGDVCYGPSPDTCFLNGCAAGYQSILYDEPGGAQQVCSAFCTPVDNRLGAVVDLDGAGAANCSAARVGVAGQECRFLQGIYDAEGFDGSIIPSSFGTCAPAATWGSCAVYDPAGMVAAYNGGYTAAAGTPADKEAAGQVALCTFCGLTADCDGVTAPQCLNVGCLSLDAQAVFDAQYLGP